MLDKTQIDVPSETNKATPKIIFGVCIIAFALIGCLLFTSDAPADSYFSRSPFFWYRLVWFDLIFVAFWFSFRGNHITKLVSKRQQTGAMHAIIGSLYFKAALYSLVIWGIGSVLPQRSPWNILPIAVQIVLILFYAVIIYFSQKIQELQVQGQEIIPDELKTPEQLAEMIYHSEQSANCSQELKSSLKAIREQIKYSLPRAGKIASLQSYRDLVQEVERLLNCIAANEVDKIAANKETVEQKIFTVIGECKN